MLSSSIILTAMLAVSSVLAHGGPALAYKELTRRASLSKRCEAQAAAMNKKRWERRQARRDLASRDLAPRTENTTTVTITTEAPYYDVLQNDTCILTADVTAGPYVWPRSQTLRQDMTEDQAGVPLYLDIGVMDTSTCEPMENVLVDLWHCNGTGSYSSFTGLSPNIPYSQLLEELNVTLTPNGTFDIHTDDTTFLRGMWPTDENGMIEMRTVFPGFYVERTIHIHVQVHTDWVTRANGTIVTSETVSTGQVFFGEELSEQIMALEPYASHTQINRTTNAVDQVFPEEAANGWDPTMAVVPLDGEDVTKGMVGYITIGVDTEAAARLKKRTD